MSLIHVPNKIDNQGLFLQLCQSSDMFINLTDEEMNAIIYSFLYNLNELYVNNKHFKENILEFLLNNNFNNILDYFNIKFDNELLIDFKEKILLEKSTEISSIRQLLFEGGVKSIHINKKQMGGDIDDPQLDIKNVNKIDINSIKFLLKILNQAVVEPFEEANSDIKLNDIEAKKKYAIFTKLELDEDEVKIFNKVNNILLILKFNHDDNENDNSHEYISFYEYICCNVLKIPLPNEIELIFLDKQNNPREEFLRRKKLNDTNIKTLKSLIEMRNNILYNYIFYSESIRFDWDLDNLYNCIKLTRESSTLPIINILKKKCIEILKLNLIYGFNSYGLNIIKKLLYEAHVNTTKQLDQKYPENTLSEYEKIFINISKIKQGHIFFGSDIIKQSPFIPEKVKEPIVYILAMLHNFTNARELQKLTNADKQLQNMKQIIYRNLLLQKQFIKIIEKKSFFSFFDQIEIHTDNYEDNFEKNKKLLISTVRIEEEIEKGIMIPAFDDKERKSDYIKYMEMIIKYKNNMNKCIDNVKKIFTILSTLDGSDVERLKKGAEELGILLTDEVVQKYKECSQQLSLSYTEAIEYFKNSELLKQTTNLLELGYIHSDKKREIKLSITSLLETIKTLPQIDNPVIKRGGVLKTEYNDKLRKYFSKKNHKLRISKKKHVYK